MSELIITQCAALARTTYLESVRGRTLHATLFLGALVMFLSTLFGLVTLGDQLRVVKDFGLFVIGLSATLFAVISGSAFVSKEITRKTVFNVLSKPVERWQFLIGKFIGMFLVSCLVVVLLGVLLFVQTSLLGDPIRVELLVGLLFILCEVMIVCSVVIFFSSIVVTPALAGGLSFAIFIAGRSSEYFLYFIEQKTISGPVAWLLWGFYWVLPNLDQLNIADLVVYSIQIPSSQIYLGALYAASYSAALLALSTIFFAKREFR